MGTDTMNEEQKTVIKTIQLLSEDISEMIREKFGDDHKIVISASNGRATIELSKNGDHAFVSHCKKVAPRGPWIDLVELVETYSTMKFGPDEEEDE